MLVPPNSSPGLLALAQSFIGASVVLNALLLLSGLYQIADRLERSRSLEIDADLAIKAFYALTGFVGLFSFTAPLRRCLTGKLWLSLTMSILCLVASGFLALKSGLQRPADGGGRIVLVGTAVVCLLQCLVATSSLFLTLTWRNIRSPPAAPMPPLQLYRMQQSRCPLQLLPQPQLPAAFARRFDGPHQHAAAEARGALSGPAQFLMPPSPPPVPPPPPPYFPFVKPPDYSQSVV